MDTKIDAHKRYVSVIKASEITGRPVAEVEQLCRTGKVSSRVVSGEWFLPEEVLSSYFNLSLSSDTPLVHLVKEKDLNSKVLIHSTPLSIVLGKTVNLLTAITLVFGGYFTLFNPQGKSAMREVFGYVEKTLDYSTDMMAFVGYGVFDTIESTQSANIFTSLENYFYPKGVINEKVYASGMVVAPSTGDASADKDLIAQIKDSFSDEVSVIPGKDGRTGIVKPVFKKSSDQSYVYVMVPVKK